MKKCNIIIQMDELKALPLPAVEEEKKSSVSSSSPLAFFKRFTMRKHSTSDKGEPTKTKDKADAKGDVKRKMWKIKVM